MRGLFRVGILGFSRRIGAFSELGLRSWEEAGCAAVEAALMRGNEQVYVVHRPMVIRITRPAVQKLLRDWCDTPHPPSRCHLVLTVGAAGFTKDDIVPEATRPLLNHETPGIAELLRRAVADAGYPLDSVTRGLAGIRRGTLLINLPGDLHGHANPAPLFAATESLLPILPTLLADIESLRS